MRAEAAATAADAGKPGYGKTQGKGTEGGTGAAVDFVFKGELVNGKAGAVGVRQWSNGDRYAGELKNSAYDGFATVVVPGQLVETGIFQFNGLITGVVKYEDGSEDVGEFSRANDFEFAIGVKSLQDGTKLKGRFKEGELEGAGAVFDNDGTVVQEGTFTNGELKR